MLHVKEDIQKFYILVRQDITPGYQIAQSVHAKDQFTHDFPEIENKWYHESNTIVILGVENLNHLIDYYNLFQTHDIKCSMFYEPDILEYTAIAVEPKETTMALLSNLISAMKGYKLIMK